MTHTVTRYITPEQRAAAQQTIRKHEFQDAVNLKYQRQNFTQRLIDACMNQPDYVVAIDDTRLLIHEWEDDLRIKYPFTGSLLARDYLEVSQGIIAYFIMNPYRKPIAEIAAALAWTIKPSNLSPSLTIRCETHYKLVMAMLEAIARVNGLTLLQEDDVISMSCNIPFPDPLTMDDYKLTTNAILPQVVPPRLGEHHLPRKIGKRSLKVCDNAKAIMNQYNDMPYGICTDILDLTYKVKKETDKTEDEIRMESIYFHKLRTSLHIALRNGFDTIYLSHDNADSRGRRYAATTLKHFRYALMADKPTPVTVSTSELDLVNQYLS